MSWYCNCGVLNSGINTSCAAIKHYRNIEHYQISKNSLDYMMFVASGAWKGVDYKLTEQEDKFTGFFNNEMVLISAMSPAEVIDHIQELEEIAFEAKARLTAAKTYQRDQNGKKRAGGEWTVTPVEPDQTVTDTINRVKLREKRMTKLDKTRANLEKLGLDKKTIDSMMAAMMKAAANSADAASTQIEQEKKKDSQEEKDSQKDSPGVVEPSNQPSIVVPDIEPSKPLDLSTLKFK